MTQLIQNAEIRLNRAMLHCLILIWIRTQNKTGTPDYPEDMTVLVGDALISKENNPLPESEQKILESKQVLDKSRKESLQCQPCWCGF